MQETLSVVGLASLSSALLRTWPGASPAVHGQRCEACSPRLKSMSTMVRIAINMYSSWLWVVYLHVTCRQTLCAEWMEDR